MKGLENIWRVIIVPLQLAWWKALENQDTAKQQLNY